MRSTSGPTFVYGALTISYSFATRAPYQLDRSSGEITTSKPASFAVGLDLLEQRLLGGDRLVRAHREAER